MGNALKRPAKTRRILAVDDEREILGLYTTFLQYKGYEVVAVDNAVACLNFLREDQADILLLDINMPGIDGLKVLEMIRAEPKSAEMRVIMVSARRDESTVRSAVKGGCDGFVVKPFKLKELVDRIETELFSISEGDIRMLFRVNMDIRTGVFREPGLTDQNSLLWDPYVVKFNGATLCILVPRGVRPGNFARSLPEDMEKRVMIFYRHPQKWKRIWPRVSRA